MALEDFEAPIRTAVRTTFVTARAAARRSPIAAIESMRRQFSAELGRHGIRFVTLRTGGVPETIPAEVEGRDAIVGQIEGDTMLGRAATLDDVGHVAAFAASDRARTMTATAVNISCGSIVD
jgi:3-oxoacyl-[acyl-carrier protein] reductase